MTLTRQLVALALTAFTIAAAPYQDLNTPRTFPNISSKQEWQTRAQKIREQILISAGLFPMPEKTPLKSKIFGKIMRDGYSVEKVYFQSLPGFYMGGNLYRPVGQGNGPFPAILNPHGHAAEGRLADDKSFSAAARCINFARQGMIAFSYDMVGFNDTHFPYPEGFVAGPTNAYKTHRQFATNAECLLWNINLLGLQTWDSIRALDFLETLPDVDKTRLACTGESGGGTQTYMLGAVDDRLAAQAPIVMVSHIMQGGCSCENAPGLRLDYSNVEIAAVPAPRPQLLVAASGDWTKDTLTMEGPSIQSIYKLFDQANQFHYVRFDFPHNYNRTSREAVYQWLGDAFLHRADADIIKETAYTKEPDLDLRVFPGGKLPGDAVTQQQLIEWMMKRTKTQLAALEKNPVEHQKFLRTAWQHILQLNLPKGMVKSDFGLTQETVNYTRSRVNMQRTGKGDRLSAWLFYPTTNLQHTFVIVADQPGCLNTSDEPIGLAEKLLARGYPILLPDVFQSTDKHKEVELYYTTYNKTLMQERVQDLIAASAFVHIASEAAKNRIVICGGPSAILASPHVDAVLADCQQRNFTDEKTLLEPDLFVPGIQAIGGFAALADPKTVHLHNIKKSAKLDEDAVVKWVSQVK